MFKNIKITRELFCKKFKAMRHIRRADKIQFEILFNEYKRAKLGRI